MYGGQGSNRQASFLSLNLHLYEAAAIRNYNNKGCAFWMLKRIIIMNC